MAILLTFLLRWLLVVLFFPFSALDKILNFEGAVGQCQEMVKPRTAATVMLLAGLSVEVFCSLGVISGVADRLAALILGLYCMATAVLFKQFWAPGDFWARGASKARDLFWDFLKNFSLAAGILLVTFGTGPVALGGFLANPLASTHPYARYSAGAAP